MYHSKKIGVFISHIMGYYQKNVCQGIIDKALEYGYTAEIFTTLDGENLGDYGIGEKSIIELPDYKDYCGFIFASDTYPFPELKNQIYDSLHNCCDAPVVEIAVTNQQFPSVALNNNLAITDLVSHLIETHHARRICYLGCRTETYHSDSREQYYRQTMEQAGLSVNTEDVYSCNYDQAEVQDALRSFLSAEKKPDAVVCYNDRMALLFMTAALNAGYRIPEDFAVTGNDNTQDGQFALPSLTTLTFPVYELGEKSVSLLIDSIRGKSIPQRTEIFSDAIYASSCGCHKAPSEPVINYHAALNSRIHSLEDSILISMRMTAAFQRITDLDEGLDLLETYIQNIEHCREFYLCLYADWESPVNAASCGTADAGHSAHAGASSSDEVLLKLAIRDHKRLPECCFRRPMTSSLLPEHIYKAADSAYIYTPLFFENKQFGYIALSYEENRLDYHFRLVHWFMNINQMLHSICEAKNNALLLRQLENFTEKDTLTGLPNWKTYHNKLEKMLTGTACISDASCILIHLDHLSLINDKYGLAAGDFAIQVVSQAIISTLPQGALCTRFNGGEFYILITDCTKAECEDFVARVTAYLDHYNQLNQRSHALSVSCGFSRTAACDLFTDGIFSTANVQALHAAAHSNMMKNR